MIELELGSKLVMTRNVHQRSVNDAKFLLFIEQSMERYVNADWGDTCKEDAKRNDDAIKNGERILAVYKYNAETTIWIITEADRSATTILFPDEY